MERAEVDHLQAERAAEQRQARSREEQRMVEYQQLERLYQDEVAATAQLRAQLHEKEKQAVISRCRKEDSEDSQRLREERDAYGRSKGLRIGRIGSEFVWQLRMLA